MSQKRNKIPMRERPIAITDVETTGLIPGHHEIIEVGLVVVNQRTLEAVHFYETKVAPLFPERATPEALRVNGYDPDAWKTAPNLESVMSRYAALTEGAMFCAHNVAFDWPFICHAFESTGVQNLMDYHRLCSMTMAWTLLRKLGLEKVNQNAVAEFLGLPPEPPVHRAMNGAMLAYEIFKKLASM